MGRIKSFAVFEAGLTKPLRPTLRQAVLKIDALTLANLEIEYGVIDPICKISATFRKDIELPKLTKDDLSAIPSYRCLCRGDVKRVQSYAFMSALCTLTSYIGLL